VWWTKCKGRGATHRLDDHSLHPLFLASPLYVLGRFNPIEVVDCDIAALFCEGGGEELAETAMRVY